jgi:hypothetical protein
LALNRKKWKKVLKKAKGPTQGCQASDGDEEDDDESSICVF